MRADGALSLGSLLLGDSMSIREEVALWDAVERAGIVSMSAIRRADPAIYHLLMAERGIVTSPRASEAPHCVGPSDAAPATSRVLPVASLQAEAEDNGDDDGEAHRCVLRRCAGN
jgi:hypothetical protein